MIRSSCQFSSFTDNIYARTKDRTRVGAMTWADVNTYDRRTMQKNNNNTSVHEIPKFSELATISTLLVCSRV